VIEEIVPVAVATAEAFNDPPDVFLHPQERAAVARAVDRRRREFATARLCARQALETLGLPPVPIVPDSSGAPQWPTGVVGSMTHCEGYRAAALARSTDISTIGIDAEPDRPLPNGVLEAIALAQERDPIYELELSSKELCWDRLLFCAKEAVFKAWYPLTRRPLEFKDAVVEIDPAANTFRARLLAPGLVVAGRQVNSLLGRWLAAHGLIVTSIILLPNSGQLRDRGAGERS
jgi:4'-phosphopantetheinyl transferase EntD